MRISDWSSDVCSSDLRTRSVRAFQVHRLAGIAAVAGGDVARRAALADVEADRAGIEIAVAGVAQIAQAALQVAAQAGLLVFDLETDGLRVGAAEGDEIGACLLPAPADADRSEEHTSELQSLMRMPSAV